MTPPAFLRRSPLEHRLATMGATWRPLADCAIAERVQNGAAEAAICLVDLTALPRLGFKGRGTMEASAKRGIALEPEPNRAFLQADAGLCLVLARSEIVLLAPPNGDGARLARLADDWRLEDLDRSYPVPRRDGGCWLRIAGDRAPDMFAKLCGIDLRLHKFPGLAIAQTSVARLNGVICRQDIGARPAFHLLADWASADYLFDCLIDAMGEFDGKVGGIADLEAA
jgi:sarcosine oxidase, subunit gamma